MTPEQERAEARKVLEAVEPVYQVYDSEDGDDHYPINLIGSRGFEDDVELPSVEYATLLANAPTWLRNSLDREEQLIAENVKLKHRDKVVSLANETLGRYVREGSEENDLLKAKVAEQDKEIQKLRGLVKAISDTGH